VPSFTGMVDVQDLIETAWSKPHPVDNSILLQSAMCLAASRQGDRVLLHGASGDLTMGVPVHYPAHLLRAGQWQEAWTECKAASRNNTYLRGSPPTSLLMSSAVAAYVPGVVEALKSPLRRLLGRTPLARSVINPRFARKLQLEERLRMQGAEARRHAGDTIRQVHAQALNSLARGPVLGLAGCERVAGRYGVELRDPWADRRVIEFFLRLPLKYKARSGWNKYLARTAFKQDLEESVRLRLGKEHLGWLFAGRLMDETGAFVSRTLEQNLDSLEPFVDINAVRARSERYQMPGRELDRQFVFEMVSLASWMRRLSNDKQRIRILGDSRYSYDNF